MAVAKPGPFPFIPDMEDCRRIVNTTGGTCYIMDTYCRNMTAGDKERADREILRIALAHAMRKKEQGTA